MRGAEIGPPRKCRRGCEDRGLIADRGALEETRHILKEPERRIEGSLMRQGRIPATRRILKGPRGESTMGGLMWQGGEFRRCQSEA